MQTKTNSAIEVTTNTALGFLLAILAQQIVYPLYNMKVTVIDNIELAAIFTVISLIRGYGVRRFFNWMNK